MNAGSNNSNGASERSSLLTGAVQQQHQPSLSHHHHHNHHHEDSGREDPQPAAEYSGHMYGAVTPLAAHQATHQQGLYNAGLRRAWLSEKATLKSCSRSDLSVNASASASASVSASDASLDSLRFKRNPSYQSIPILTGIEEYDEEDNTAGPSVTTSSLFSHLSRLSGLAIAVILNMFLSVSFGQALFPSSLVLPPEIPRSLGINMFLFATGVSQAVLTMSSDFPCAVGMMMVENLPFLQIMANIIVQSQGNSVDAFSTIFVTYSLSSIFVGIVFYVLGKFELGNAVYFFPRHVITGCIGGIGIFIMTTGIEIATNRAWLWDLPQLYNFVSNTALMKLLAGAVAFEIPLRILLSVMPPTVASFLPPLYFISIPFIFYLILFACRIPVAEAYAHGWFFGASDTPSSSSSGGDLSSNALLMWSIIRINNIRWDLIVKCIPTVFAMSIFSVMHVPINIPSLSISTRIEVDMNKELIAHGYSNLLSGFLGGLQNYLCYSNSLLYYKCNGGGKITGYLLTAITAIIFIYGPSGVVYIPRVMPGCLLIHIGIDLTLEAIGSDSLAAFDAIEYASVLSITLTMTLLGMTEGLVLGVICAALTFTLQTSSHVEPIRGKMTARTLRSSRWRSPEDVQILERFTRCITAMQLQGHLFFGNATLLASEVSNMLSADPSIRYLILDFTLVVGIDSSAAETIAKLFQICRKFDVKVSYSSGCNDGFPCTFPLSQKLRSLVSGRETKVKKCRPDRCGRCGTWDPFTSSTHRSATCRSADCGLVDELYIPKHLFVANHLDDALAWCEDLVIYNAVSARNKLPSLKTYDKEETDDKESPSLSPGLIVFNEDSLIPLEPAISPGIRPPVHEVPLHLHQLYNLCSEPDPAGFITKLVSYFASQSAPTSHVLWTQGNTTHSAVLLVSGLLMNMLEDEAGTTELIYPGHLVGEFSLITNRNRQGTLIAQKDCELLVLSRQQLEKMRREDPFSALVLNRICLEYLGQRAMRVENRIWESRCVPA